MSQYVVIVGNVGTVYSGEDSQKASEIFAEYVEQSKSDCGHAGGEDVSLLHNDDIIQEYMGGNSQDSYYCE